MKGISPQMSDNIKKVILCKYGEVALKGANRHARLESAMLKDIARRVHRYETLTYTQRRALLYIESKEGVDVDFKGMKNAISRVFGISAYWKPLFCRKISTLSAGQQVIYLPPLLRSASTCGAEAKRADKAFPIKSPELAAEIPGRVVLSSVPVLKSTLTTRT